MTLLKVGSYYEARNLLRRCRNPKDGKSLSSWLKMYDSAGGIAFVTDGQVPLGFLTPDNVFTFTVTTGQAYQISPTMVRCLHKILPFYWERKSKCLYEIVTRYGSGTPIAVSTLFNGLRVNIVTGEIYNKLYIDTDKVDVEARRKWLRSLRKYKQGIKVRTKLGVFDRLREQVVEERGRQTRYNWKQPDWMTEAWIDKLAKSIEHEDFNLDLLKGIVETAEVSLYNRKITNENIVSTFDGLVADLSVYLRAKFGVFGECDALFSVQKQDAVSGHEDSA